MFLQKKTNRILLLKVSSFLICSILIERPTEYTAWSKRVHYIAADTYTLKLFLLPVDADITVLDYLVSVLV